ncbi:DUF4229 domain-containing protein [Frondihabitans cladoniiphilus]|uniref:DUF4229 domain-containing protein n=1 Tax=Frondihabitans cladoniiphilus TaxID=715785 RepID=A0ABP8W246_9MICO
MKATLLYSLARIGVFVVAFIVFRFTPMPIWLAAILAAVVALLISYIFFGALRKNVALAIVKRRAAPERDDDADLEDAVLDARADVTGAAGTSAAVPSKARPAAAPRRPGPPAEDE